LQLHGKAKSMRLPPSYAQSEGAAFDVVNNR
jgi:hypothetical protein